MKSRALLVLALVGCPKAEDDADTAAPTDTADTTTTDTPTEPTDTTTETGCASISAGTFEANLLAEGSASYTAPITTPLGGELPDLLNLQLYGSAFGPGLDGEATGTFALGAGADGNFATCSRCLLSYEDVEGDLAARTYYAISGTLTIDPSSAALDGTISATVTKAALAEVTIAPGSYESTLVEGGECLELASAKIAVTAVAR